MSSAQCDIRSVFHCQIGSLILDTKIVHAYDMGMGELRNRAGLTTKSFLLAGFHAHMQYFDGCWPLQVLMFAQVHRRERSLPQHTQQAVMAQLLPYTVNHIRSTLQEKKK